ncbi:MAG TPA: cell envelope integrity protein TolA [Gallionella sp.]|nr:cell envelope integrity protein TolA [Gallionella sp.]
MSAIVYREPYKLPAGVLAVAVHGAFFALLYFGFAWQTQPAGTMSVELWQSLPGAVAAPPAQRRIEEAVQPPPQPEAVIKPDVTQPPQPEKMVEPDIALPDKKKAVPDKKKVEAKPVMAKPDKKKLAPSVAEGTAKSAGQGTGTSIADQAARERAERTAVMGRVVDEYTGKIVSKIRSNIVMPPSVANDARAEFSVTLLPGGAVLSARLTKSSGNAAYDNAVERAILKSQPLPLPADVAMFNKFRELKLVFKPVE